MKNLIDSFSRDVIETYKDVILKLLDAMKMDECEDKSRREGWNDAIYFVKKNIEDLSQELFIKK